MEEGSRSEDRIEEEKCCGRVRRKGRRKGWRDEGGTSLRMLMENGKKNQRFNLSPKCFRQPGKDSNVKKNME